MVRSQQKSLDTFQDLFDTGVHGPVTVQDGVTHTAMCVDVAVTDWSHEPNLRGTDWEVVAEANLQHKHSFSLGSAMWSLQNHTPKADVLSTRLDVHFGVPFSENIFHFA